MHLPSGENFGIRSALGPKVRTRVSPDTRFTWQMRVAGVRSSVSMIWPVKAALWPSGDTCTSVASLI